MGMSGGARGGGPGSYRDDGFSSEKQSYLHVSWLRIKTSVQLLGVAAYEHS